MDKRVNAGLSQEEYILKWRHKHLWRNMLQRCNNPKATGYKNYGGRGVTVCDRWDPAKGGSYENFIADMGYRPTKKHQLDKDYLDSSSLCYSPASCSWQLPSINGATANKPTLQARLRTKKLK